MNKQREALEMALEALDSDSPDIMLRASIAIRSALAEPELWTPDDMAYRPGGLSMSAEQEPVAVVTSQTGDPAITMSWHHEPALPIGTKLYTAPPARKPLTDDEIDALADAIPGDTIDSVNSTWHIRLARAIEKAHGIGEQ